MSCGVLAGVAVLSVAILTCSATASKGSCTPNVKFISKSELSSLIAVKDVWMGDMSGTERQIRMNLKDKVPSLAEYQQFLSEQAMDWPTCHTMLVEAKFTKFLKHFQAPLPKDIYIGVTTGKEESDSAYVRFSRLANFSDAALIVFPLSMARDPNTVVKVLVHEMFHLLEPSLHEHHRLELYDAAGYKPMQRVLPPAGFSIGRNPDAYYFSFFTTVDVSGVQYNVTPALKMKALADIKFADGIQAAAPLTYCELRTSNSKMEPALDANGFWICHGKDVWTKLVNTLYNFHPEEICSENFRFVAGDYIDEIPAGMKNQALLDTFQRVFAPLKESSWGSCPQGLFMKHSCATDVSYAFRHRMLLTSPAWLLLILSV